MEEKNTLIKKVFIINEHSNFQILPTEEKKVKLIAISVIPQKNFEYSDQKFNISSQYTEEEEQEIDLTYQNNKIFDWLLDRNADIVNKGAPLLVYLEFPENSENELFSEYSHHHDDTFQNLHDEKYFFTIQNLLDSKNPLLDLFYYLDSVIDKSYFDSTTVPELPSTFKSVLTLFLKQIDHRNLRENLYDVFNVWDLKLFSGHQITVGFYLLFRLFFEIYPEFINDALWYSIQKKYSLIYLSLLSDKKEICRPLQSISNTCGNYPLKCLTVILNYALKNNIQINDFLFDEYKILLIKEMEELILFNLSKSKKANHELQKELTQKQLELDESNNQKQRLQLEATELNKQFQKLTQNWTNFQNLFN